MQACSFLKPLICLHPLIILTCLFTLSSQTAAACLMIGDPGNLDMGFHPKDLNSSYRQRADRKLSDGGHGYEGTKPAGTIRLTFNIPKPNICGGCNEPNGSCGAGLRCLCHPKECKDTVMVSTGAEKLQASWNLSLSVVVSIMLICSI